jgi:hypothetical protein
MNMTNEKYDAAIALGWIKTPKGWIHPAYDKPDDPPFETVEEIFDYEQPIFKNGAWRRPTIEELEGRT